MNENIHSRRKFLKIATITTAGLLGSGLIGRRARAVAQEAKDEKPLYCFPLLGDLHYDDMSYHDLDWVRAKNPGDERQMLGYSKTTATLTPHLFQNVSAAIRSALGPVPFVIQVGDLVEGLCGSQDLATRQFKDAFAAVDTAKFGVPFLMTKGNHDITGPGAPEAFENVLIPWLAGQAKQDIHSVNFVRQQDEDVFVFFDGYKPDLDWLHDALAKNKGRHVFFIVHQPVVPYNARANWIVFPDKKDAAQRQRLLALLGQYRAIVLGGHIHKYSLLTRTVDSGSFIQLAVCSVLRDAKEASPKGLLSGVTEYNDGLLNLEPKFAPASLDYRRELIQSEQKSISAFEYADTAGYAMLKVYADRVDADIYISLANDPWKRDILGEKTAAHV